MFKNKFVTFVALAALMGVGIVTYQNMAQKHHAEMDHAKMGHGAELPSELGPVLASKNGVSVHLGYVRATGASAKSGAAFMVLKNSGDSSDRLIAASTDAAAVTELHTHIMDGDIMMMRQDLDGFELPVGGAAHLKRGGDHIMLMGLTRSLTQGDMVDFELTFENAGKINVTLPLDLNR